VGLLRASQTEAQKHDIRVNVIAPFFTTTHLTSGISDAWVRAGLEVNTPDAVAEAIEAALLSKESGQGFLVSGYIAILLHCPFPAGILGEILLIPESDIRQVYSRTRGHKNGTFVIVGRA
jgi:NAD(P)-dependent dehydrogenase (short-subunit alcohol dehydrogenase family)